MLYDAIKKLVQYGINTGITPESERIYSCRTFRYRRRTRNH